MHSDLYFAWRGEKRSVVERRGEAPKLLVVEASTRE
jgi:hypothetical protein